MISNNFNNYHFNVQLWRILSKKFKTKFYDYEKTSWMKMSNVKTITNEKKNIDFKTYFL